MILNVGSEKDQLVNISYIHDYRDVILTVIYLETTSITRVSQAIIWPTKKSSTYHGSSKAI